MSRGLTRLFPSLSAAGPEDHIIGRAPLEAVGGWRHSPGYGRIGRGCRLAFTSLRG